MTYDEKRDFRTREMFEKVEAYLSGELTQVQFCQKEGLCKSTFQYWLRKYRKVHEPEVPASGEFLPLRLISSGTPSYGSYNCEIELSNGSPSGKDRVVIRFHSNSLSSSLLQLIYSLVK